MLQTPIENILTEHNFYLVLQNEGTHAMNSLPILSLLLTFIFACSWQGIGSNRGKYNTTHSDKKGFGLEDITTTQKFFDSAYWHLEDKVTVVNNYLEFKDAASIEHVFSGYRYFAFDCIEGAIKIWGVDNWIGPRVYECNNQWEQLTVSTVVVGGAFTIQAVNGAKIGNIQMLKDNPYFSRSFGQYEVYHRTTCSGGENFSVSPMIHDGPLDLVRFANEHGIGNIDGCENISQIVCEWNGDSDCQGFIPEGPSLDLSLTNEKANAFRDWYNNRATEKEKLAADNYGNTEPIFYRLSRNYHHLGNRDAQLRCDPNGHHKPFHTYDDFCILSYPEGTNFIDHPIDPTDRGTPAIQDGNSPSLLIHIDDLTLTNITDTIVKFDREIHCTNATLEYVSQEDYDYCQENPPTHTCHGGICLPVNPKKEESFPVKTANNLVDYREGIYHTNHKYLLNPCHLRLGDFIENGTDPQIKCDMDVEFEKFASKQVASNMPDSTEKWILGVAEFGEFVGAMAAFAVAPQTSIAVMAAFTVGKGIVEHESPVQVIEELALLIGSLYPPIMFLEMSVGLLFSLEAALDCKNHPLDFAQSCAGAYENLALNLGMMAFMGGQMYKHSEPITEQHLSEVLNETGETKPLLKEEDKSSIEEILDESEEELDDWLDDLFSDTCTIP